MISKTRLDNLVAIKLPPLGAEKGGKALLIRWNFAQGQNIEEGQELVELEAEKCAFAVESPAKGILEEILSQEGDTIQEGQTMAYMRINEHD